MHTSLLGQYGLLGRLSSVFQHDVRLIDRCIIEISGRGRENLGLALPTDVLHDFFVIFKHRGQIELLLQQLDVFLFILILDFTPHVVADSFLVRKIIGLMVTDLRHI